MKFISKNLIAYSFLLLAYSLIFRYTLSSLLDAEKFILAMVSGVVYGVLIFITAWILGKAHSVKKFVFDAGLGFNVTTYIVWGLVSELWFILGFNSKYESIISVHYALIIWGVFLVLHFLIYWRLRSKTIKGVLKSEIFD
jgi:magnesium-transporting ATPase (P-type)